jgi:hypothetical protein
MCNPENAERGRLSRLLQYLDEPQCGLELPAVCDDENRRAPIISDTRAPPLNYKITKWRCPRSSALNRASLDCDISARGGEGDWIGVAGRTSREFAGINRIAADP